MFFQCKQEKSSEEETAVSVVRQPAEYEPQEALWLIWYPYRHMQGYSNVEVIIQMVQAVLPFQKVIMTAMSDEDSLNAIENLPNSILADPNFALKVIPSVQLWVRDMGPNFVQLQNGKLAIADFNFNSWGYADSENPDNKIEEAYDRNVADRLGYQTINTTMISEGGNRDLNALGTLMVVEKVEKGRNPNMTKEEMEREYARLLGVKNVIWLKEGLREDDHTFLGPIETEKGWAYTLATTNGHVDEFARFVNDSTIFIAELDSIQLASNDPVAIENKRRLDENFSILQSAINADGKKFNIVRFPIPNTMIVKMPPGDEVYEFIKTLDYKSGMAFPQGDTINAIGASSYLNFVITNEVILVPTYVEVDKGADVVAREQRALALLSQYFPERKVVTINAFSVNLGGGGMHCISMHQPKCDKE